jgi:hypothetical protein
MSGLALEQSDRPGLSTFLAGHLSCEGGTDIELRGGEEGAMIRVTCTHCGMAIEAPAASWEGWGEERTRDAGSPARRFEPGRRRLGRRRTRGSSGRRPPTEIERDQVRRDRLITGVIAAWVTAGFVLFAIAILWR